MKWCLLISFLCIILFVRVQSEKGSLGICDYEATCNVNGYEGACVSISSGCCSGTVTSGLCPGSSDIKCCTQSACSTPSGSGTCMQTSACSSQGGSSIPGYCTGPSDLQCCVKQNPSCSYESTCSANGYAGVCVSISEGCCSGTVTSGLCPGSSDIKCCTQSTCSTPAGSGTCMQTSLCASQGGSSVAGYCVGPSDLQCCVKGGGGEVGLGVDISSTISPSIASCLKSSGVSFVIPRGYMQVGRPDDSVCPTLINAANAGIEHRDVYIYPCMSKTANQQMSELISYLQSNCASYWSGRIWLDIEAASDWLGSYEANQNFYRQLVDACSIYGVRCGVYSSSYQWQSIFGSSSFSYGANLPLWYAHWDYSASFSDFSPFGGWSSPHAKQYVGDTSLCGMNVDKDYAPAF